MKIGSYSVDKLAKRLLNGAVSGVLAGLASGVGLDDLNKFLPFLFGGIAAGLGIDVATFEKWQRQEKARARS